jgi:hypothetical protein
MLFSLNFRSQSSAYADVKNVFTDEAGCELLLLSSKSHSIVSNKRKKQAISELQQRQEPTSGNFADFRANGGQILNNRRHQTKSEPRNPVLLVLGPSSEKAKSSSLVCEFSRIWNRPEAMQSEAESADRFKRLAVPLPGCGSLA